MVKKIGRNDPCPCGSGKKYKKCCLGKEMDETPNKLLTKQESASRLLDEFLEKEKIRKENFGAVHPFITETYKGCRFVAVGENLYYSERWLSPVDFLLDYFWLALFEIIQKPLEEDHLIQIWYKRAVEFIKKMSNPPYNTGSAFPNGSMQSFVLLSYDLYTVRHNMAYQKSVLKRIPHKNNFQGARYELFAAATCVRAGFSIDYEQEEKGERKYTEFIATHRKTGQKVSLEAKSQDRPGVLGQPGNIEDDVKRLPRFGRLLKDAFKKKPRLPYVIFLDLNLPFGETLPEFEILQHELERRVKEANHPLILPDPYNLLLLTNHPYQSDETDNPAPPGAFMEIIPKEPLIKVKYEEVLIDIIEAAKNFWRIPQSFEEGS